MKLKHVFIFATSAFTLFTGFSSQAQNSASWPSTGDVQIGTTNVIHFGNGTSPTQYAEAGKIGYQKYTTGALDITGAGTTSSNRKIKFWAESGSTFTGGGAFAGNVDIYFPTTWTTALSLSNDVTKGGTTLKSTMAFGISNCNGCYSSIATPGDGVMALGCSNTEDLILVVNNGSNGGIRFATGDGLGSGCGTDYERMTIKATGSIGINTTSPNTSSKLHVNGGVLIGDGTVNMPSAYTSTGYGLYVQYGILTEKIKVATKGSTEWPDFVFEKDYKLTPLSELETFINKNKHLPEIPSTEEVNKNGVDLLEMDAKLLQKIEELTLYMIDMKKENEQLKTKVANLENQISK